MGTFVPSSKDINRKWFVVDASGKTLGRLATKAADVLSGKLIPSMCRTSTWETTSSSLTRRRSA